EGEGVDRLHRAAGRVAGRDCLVHRGRGVALDRLRDAELHRDRARLGAGAVAARGRAAPGRGAALARPAVAARAAAAVAAADLAGALRLAAVAHAHRAGAHRHVAARLGRLVAAVLGAVGAVVAGIRRHLHAAAVDQPLDAVAEDAVVRA